MAGNLWFRPRIVEAFYHELLGVVLIYCVEEGVGDEVAQISEPRYLHTESDGDEKYLAAVRDNLREFWLEPRADFSAN